MPTSQLPPSGIIEIITTRFGGNRPCFINHGVRSPPDYQGRCWSGVGDVCCGRRLTRCVQQFVQWYVQDSCHIYTLTVEAGHRALVYNRLSGVSDTLFGEGTHFIIPWFQRPIIYDVRTRPRTLTSLTGSRGRYSLLCAPIMPSDLQMVNITCRVLSRPDERRLREVYRYAAPTSRRHHFQDLGQGLRRKDPPLNH